MNYPVTIHIGHASILLHSIMELAATFIAFRYYLLLKRRQQDVVSDQNRILVIVAAAFGAVLGARIIGSLENLPEWGHSADKLSYFWGNKTLAGGLVGGLASVELTKKLIKEKQSTGDLFVYPLLLGMIIGRIGCFSAGMAEETYGLPSYLPWAINLGDGIPRHPVTLYEIAMLILLWICLKLAERKYVFQPGAKFKVVMIVYMIFRLLQDFIKPGWRYLFGLGTIQITAILTLLYYYRYLLHPQLLIISRKKTPALQHQNI
ncbi:prolipoprotein diacylglyceryl transferase [Chitinophagaceae bacterium MMS25-I14]